MRAGEVNIQREATGRAAYTLLCCTSSCFFIHSGRPQDSKALYFAINTWHSRACSTVASIPARGHHGQKRTAVARFPIVSGISLFSHLQVVLVSRFKTVYLFSPTAEILNFSQTNCVQRERYAASSRNCFSRAPPPVVRVAGTACLGERAGEGRRGG